MESFLILKIEEVREENGENILLIWAADQKSRVILRFPDFSNFFYIELPEVEQKWNKKTVAQFISSEISWKFSYRQKYYGYSKKKFPVLTVFSDINFFSGFVDDLQEYFTKLMKKDTKKDIKLQTYLTGFTLVQKFSAMTKINPGHWVKLNNFQQEESINNFQVFSLGITDLEKTTPGIQPVLRILCLDFEVNSHRKGKFPDPWEPEDEVYLASVVQNEGTNKQGYLIVSKDLPFTEIKNREEDKPSPVIIAENELDLFSKLEQLILRLDPDILMTYNGSGFDFPYWKARIDREGESLGYFGRLPWKTCSFQKNNWSSSAHKAREQQLLRIPGRIVIDLYSIVRRDRFEDLYTLKHISEQILGTAGMKDELEAEEQFRIYASGTNDEWERLLHYSLRDSWAPLDIAEKISTITNLLAMASIIGINIDDIYSRGQQYRLENKIFQRLLTEGIVVDGAPARGYKDFKGALVQDPITGMHKNVACIDFNSLYPSIMIRYNISHDTFCGTNIKSPPSGLVWEDLYEHVIESKRKHYFVKQHVKIGTLSDLLKDFLDNRAIKKAELKKATDPVVRTALDAEQNGLKIIANSGYGFMGAQDGKMPLLPGAETVTFRGRDLISQVADILKQFGAEIIYGDTDSIFFTFARWRNKDGPEQIREMMKESDKISDEITEKLAAPPIKIVLDHFYTEYLCIKKKCDIKNEVITNKDGSLDLKTSFKGVLYVRREHNAWIKKLYKSLAISCLGRTDWSRLSSIKERENRCKDLLWEGMIKMASRSTPLEDIQKISQAGREPKEYAVETYPIRRFMEREEKMGKPIKVGERFKWWLIRANPSKTKVYRGDYMRRTLEPDDKIDTMYYLDSLKIPVNRLFKTVFGTDDIYNQFLGLIKQKRKINEEIERRPYPIPFKKNIVKKTGFVRIK